MGISRRGQLRLQRRALLVIVAAVLSLVALAVPGVALAAGTVTYTATQTIPVPPASAYAGSGGGDGWAVALSSTAVYNVFHHNSYLTVACHLQSDASSCWAPETITDSTGAGFLTSGHPGLWLDQSTGKLYAYATRADGAAGVVCIDTTAAATNPNPFCGFTALTAPDPAALFGGISPLSEPAQVGTKWFAFNYVNGAAAGAAGSGENTLLCFDVSTKAACPSQPYAVGLGADPLNVGAYPEPQVAVIGGLVVIAARNGASDLLSCFDAALGRSCSGTWPVSAPAGYAASYGAPFPLLSAAGTVTGFCLPDGTDECFGLSGSPVATPAGMPAAIPATSGWNGQAVVLGPRVYVPNGNRNEVDCFDANTGATCANFPKSLPNLSLLYTVNPDPARPTCLWVNADGGSGQLQNFDAYTGGACGQGPIRVLASSFVVPTQLCQPATYTSLQVTDPAPGTYGSGTVAFQDGDAQPLPGLADRALNGSGTADLSGLNLSTAVGLPQFLITLTGAQGTPGAVTVKLTWTGTDDPSCVKPGTTTSGGSSGSGWAPCGNTVVLAAMGSGQRFSSAQDLSPSKQLTALLDSVRATAAASRKTVGLRVIQYPAMSVDRLTAGLRDISVPWWIIDPRARAAYWVAKVNDLLSKNTADYLAGEKQGVTAMQAEFINVLSGGCPQGTKIMVVGYSQGAMVAHEFLNELAASRNPADVKQTVIGAGLIADPERVKWSSPVEFSDAAPSSYGICALLSARVHCAAPDPLTDISPTFARVTASVCSYFDPVCDTSQILPNWAALANSSARNSAIALAKQTHESYAWMPETKTAGKWLGRRVVAHS